VYIGLSTKTKGLKAKVRWYMQS